MDARLCSSMLMQNFDDSTFGISIYFAGRILEPYILRDLPKPRGNTPIARFPPGIAPTPATAAMRVGCGQLDPGTVIRPEPAEWHPRIPERLNR
jgi:hypothetical protein